MSHQPNHTLATQHNQPCYYTSD